MDTNLSRYSLTADYFCRNFGVVGASKQIFLAISIVFLVAFHFSAHADTSQSAYQLSEDMLKDCKISKTPCKKEELIPEHLDMLNRHLSENMLLLCKISKTLCKEEDLIPEHLEELE